MEKEKLKRKPCIKTKQKSNNEGDVFFSVIYVAQQEENKVRRHTR